MDRHLSSPLAQNRAETIAQSWPSVEGVILGGSVTPIPKTKQFHVVLQYTYFVGKYRSGKYLHHFPDQADADDFVRQLKDKRIYIRYNQSNPDRSVLQQNVVQQHFLLAPRFG